ncbi:MAG: hypothetical protein BGO03_11905 [Mesorhizobium sp. 61-13]|nr:MAG: hypothetical protein BGO03_11905 [Mesorhizobium sp. 61-13]
MLYLYFLTCEHQNSAGCFRLPNGYASADLGWPTEQYMSVRQILIDGEMIAFDAATSTIYVERWFQHCAAMSDKHAIGIRRVISAIESDVIREKVEADFEASEVLRKGIQNPLDVSFSNGSHLLKSNFMTGRAR